MITTDEVKRGTFVWSDIIAEMRRVEAHLLRPELRHRFDFEGEMHLINCPCEGGVYAIFIDGKIVYVGETCNLYARVREMRETRNHTIRRHLGEELFSVRSDYVRASASRCFPGSLETELDQYLEEHVSISWCSVCFGRKEIEEYLCATYQPKYCRPMRRRYTRGSVASKD